MNDDIDRNAPEDIDPFEPEDIDLFLSGLWPEHNNPARASEAGHKGRLDRCPECRYIAYEAARICARKMRRLGLDREGALEYVQTNPRCRTTFVIEAGRAIRASIGRSSKPKRAGTESDTYRAALELATARGELAQSVALALEFLGEAIASAQSEDGAIEYGHQLPWDYLGGKVGLTAQQAAKLFSDIVLACDEVPRARRMLDDHIFKHSAGSTRHVMPSGDANDETDPFESSSAQPMINADELVDRFESLFDDATIKTEDYCLKNEVFDRDTVRRVFRAYAERSLGEGVLDAQTLNKHAAEVFDSIQRTRCALVAAARVAATDDVSEAAVDRALRDIAVELDIEIAGDREAWFRRQTPRVRARARQMKREGGHGQASA